MKRGRIIVEALLAIIERLPNENTDEWFDSEILEVKSKLENLLEEMKASGG